MTEDNAERMSPCSSNQSSSSMKLSSALALLFLPARPSGAAGASVNQSVRRRLSTIPQEDPCLLVKRNTEGGNTPSTEKWTCELSLAKMQNEPEESLLKYLQQIQSGVTTLLAIGASLENGMLMVPPGALRKFGIVQPRGPAAGINADTAEAPNLVTVQSQDGESVSYLQASFGAGQSGTISNFINGETLTIRVPSIDMNASPPVANVEIYLGDGATSPHHLVPGAVVTGNCAHLSATM